MQNIRHDFDEKLFMEWLTFCMPSVYDLIREEEKWKINGKCVLCKPSRPFSWKILQRPRLDFIRSHIGAMISGWENGKEK